MWSASAQAADPNKVLRYVLITHESGFDPAVAIDLYSAQVIQSIFETLYTYEYLASPVKLMPLTADGMPTISPDAKTYTIKLKKGIYFTPDPAFKGVKRELTMADFIYALKRLLDPKVASPHAWKLEGKIIGLDEMAATAKITGHFDYDKKIEGLELVDRYTLRIHLKNPDYNLAMILADISTSAVAKEIVAQYGDAQMHVMEHPVGTGAYKLGQWVRSSKIVLDANPDFRGILWNFAPSSDPNDQKIVAALKGKMMPQIGRVEMYIIEEEQSQWLAFQNDQIDLFQLLGTLAPRAIKNGKLLPELARKGIQLSRSVDPEISYFFWNMRDPVVGGLSKEKIALRRALAMAENVQDDVDLIENGQAIVLQQPIPPGVVGHDANYRSSVHYNPAAANALLDRFGYKKGPDGWRTLPNGQTLLLHDTATSGASISKVGAEMKKKFYAAIGINMEVEFKTFSERIKAMNACQLMVAPAAWGADYPDGDNFMQLFYSKNIGLTNYGCINIAEFDSLYEQSQKMPASEERNELYRKMARVLEFYATQRLEIARYHNMLAQPRVIGYKKHPILTAEWLYFDIQARH